MSVGIAIAVVLGIATLVGAAAGGHQLWQAYRSRVPAKLGWSVVEQGVKDLIAHMRSDNYVPDVVVAIGRSGAIFGGMIAGNMNNLPIALLDRQFAWDKNRREYVQSRFSDMHLDASCKRILVVVGEVYSGQTMVECLKRLEDVVAGKEVRTCALVKSKASAFDLDYVALRVDKVVTPPWVMTPDYHRVVD